jgi:hypothetical protein
MSRKAVQDGWKQRARLLAVMAIWAMGGLVSPLAGQEPAGPGDSPAAGAVQRADVPASAPAQPEGNQELLPVGCSSCAAGSLPPLGPGCASCGMGGGCYPGRPPCDCCWVPNCAFGYFLYGVYQCICCPDPCYEGRYKALANSAFFIDQVRPVTQMRLKGDFGWDLNFPDKGEVFMPKENSKGLGTSFTFPGTKVKPGLGRLDYQDGNLYMEGAISRFGMFVEMQVRHISPEGELYPTGSGFGDMIVGTKSLLLDCELIQFSFQFATYIPTGNFTKGIGTGHVSLEPSLLGAIKVSSVSYLQGQIGHRFPLGGDQAYEGGLFHVGASYNHLLWSCGCDVQLIGTGEANYYCLRNGLYTDEFGNTQPAREIGSFCNLGAGLRLVLCEKVDFGVGGCFAVTKDRLPGQLLRCEFRWRF